MRDYRAKILTANAKINRKNARKVRFRSYIWFGTNTLTNEEIYEEWRTNETYRNILRVKTVGVVHNG